MACIKTSPIASSLSKISNLRSIQARSVFHVKALKGTPSTKAAAVPSSILNPTYPRLLQHATPVSAHRARTSLNRRLGSGLAVRSFAAMSSATEAAAGGSQDTGASVVYVTVPNQEIGQKLAASLIEAKLAACVNILPGLTSVYWWEGKVEMDPELLLIIKTKQSLMTELTAHVKANHPYDEPEVIALPVTAGSPSYLSWLMSSTKQPQ